LPAALLVASGFPTLSTLVHSILPDTSKTSMLKAFMRIPPGFRNLLRQKGVQEQWSNLLQSIYRKKENHPKFYRRRDDTKEVEYSLEYANFRNVGTLVTAALALGLPRRAVLPPQINHHDALGWRQMHLQAKVSDRITQIAAGSPGESLLLSPGVYDLAHNALSDPSCHFQASSSTNFTLVDHTPFPTEQVGGCQGPWSTCATRADANLSHSDRGHPGDPDRVYWSPYQITSVDLEINGSIDHGNIALSSEQDTSWPAAFHAQHVVDPANLFLLDPTLLQQPQAFERYHETEGNRAVLDIVMSAPQPSASYRPSLRPPSTVTAEHDMTSIDYRQDGNESGEWTMSDFMDSSYYYPHYNE